MDVAPLERVGVGVAEELDGVDEAGLQGVDGRVVAQPLLDDVRGPHVPAHRALQPVRETWSGGCHHRYCRHDLRPPKHRVGEEPLLVVDRVSPPQQMLAIGRALVAGPKLAIFDEISLGLAPVAVDRLYEALAEVNQRGVAMIVIEQNVERGLALADRVYVIEKGRIALSGTPAEMRRDPRLLALYVGEAKGAA